MATKRYVLLESDGDVSETVHDLAEFLGKRFGAMKIIEIKGNPFAVILKTTNLVAEQLKEIRDGFAVGGMNFVPVLTSGAVGNLKRRAAEAMANGKVHE